jgi:hypothetical protein
MDKSKSQVICAISLLSSATNPDNQLDLRERLGPFRHSFVREKVLSDITSESKRSFWALLESLVVYDDVFYDAHAFTRHKLSNNQTAQIAALEACGLTAQRWPVTVYQETAHAVEEMTRSGVFQLDMEAQQEAWDPFEKNYQDDLFDTDNLGRYSFADSDTQSFQRLVFYAELGKALRLGLLPRPSGSGTVLDKLRDLYERSAKKSAHAVMLETLKKFDISQRSPEMSISLPPLAQKIASRIVAGEAPLTVVADLRNSKNAIEYRRHIANLQSELNEATINAAAIATLQKTFQEIVDRWAAEGSTSEGIVYKTRAIRVQVIPAIAAYITWQATHDLRSMVSSVSATNVAAQLLFGNSVMVRDPILWGAPKYLSFVADWYR